MLTITRIILISALFLSVSTKTSAQQNGISLSQTRVVFTEGEKAQTLTVYNRGAKSYLIQTRVYNDKNRLKAAPFIVTPPLSLLEGDSQQILRLVKQDGALPSDRESVFYLSVLAVPSHTEDENRDKGNAKVSVGFRFAVKLFYRPERLASSSIQDECNLNITENRKGYVINNPTPYYQTLGMLSVNNRAVNLDDVSAMIVPHGHQQYQFKEKVQTLKWNIINDYGGFSKTCEITI